MRCDGLRWLSMRSKQTHVPGKNTEHIFTYHCNDCCVLPADADALHTFIANSIRAPHIYT